MIFNNKNILLIIIFLFAKNSYSQDQYCYRDNDNILDCKLNLEDIPSQFKTKVFFKPDLKNSLPTSSVKEKILAPEIPPASTNILSNEFPKAKSELDKNQKIQVFVAKWCGYCKALEKFLKKKNVKYDRYDVEEDPYGMKIYGIHNTVPITLINNNTIVGFEERKFEEILDASNPY